MYLGEFMEILTFKQENKLSKSELLKYYENLRDYLINTPHDCLTKGSLTFCKEINPMVRTILKKFCGYKMIIEGDKNIKNLVGIYAHTHQSKMDHVNMIASNPNHTILLNSAVLSDFYRKVLAINGVFYVNKFDKNSRERAKLEMMRLLLNEKSVTIFPESAWNLSLNKLHLPLYIGIVDIARKTKKPIIPVVQEYEYDNSKLDGIERIKSVHIKYGEPIYVSELDNPIEKLKEYSDVISTIRWNLIEEKGIYDRNAISNDVYINFLKSSIRNLKNSGIDVNVEKSGIYGANDDFYLFHHINALDFDENNNFLPTKYVRNLEKVRKY